MKKYFLYAPETGFEEYDTEDERDAAAHEAIQDYLDDGWSEEVAGVVAGEITHRATQVDRVDRPPAEEIDEDGCDREGTWWDSDCAYMCNYKLKPVAP